MNKVCLGLLCIPTIILSLEYEGLLFPAQHIVISTLSSGVVVTLPYKEGQYVKKGTILMIQDAKKDSLQMVLAERDREKSRIQKSNEIESDVAFSLKKITYDDHFIRAPINGTIIKVIAKKHEYYSVGTKVIEIADLSNLITEINVSQTKLKKVKGKGTKITVLKGNQEIKGRFYAYNPLAEPGVELVLVKIVMKNKFKWFPGTYVKVKF